MQAAPPPAYEIDDAALKAAQADASARSGGGDRLPFFEFPPPQGAQTWKSAAPNTSSTVKVWICQPAPGQRLIHHKYKKHFYYYNEGGARKASSVGCIGDNCPFDAAADMARNQPHLSASVEAWGKKAKPKWLFNILVVDSPNLHFRPDGSMAPMILDAGPTLANDILGLVDSLGIASKLVDPYEGRPVLITKKKTGNEDRDVEYSAIYSPNAEPLPQQFWPALHNIWDLAACRRAPTSQDFQQALMRLGWPMPDMSGLGAPQGAQPAPPAYNAAPMPPAANPYMQNAQAPAFPAQAPAYPQQQTMPPLPPMAPPQQFAPPMPPDFAPPPQTTPGKPQQGYYAPPPPLPGPGDDLVPF